MIEIKMTINGRPLTSNNIRDELEKSAIESIKDHIRTLLAEIPHELNGERLIVEVVGTDLHNLSVHLSGPDELVQRAQSALGAECPRPWLRSGNLSCLSSGRACCAPLVSSARTWQRRRELWA